MNPDGPVRSAEVRHALRTPLNQISGYSEMLIEELDDTSDRNTRRPLESIRDAGREILEMLQGQLPQGRAEIPADDLARLQTRMTPPLRGITANLGALLSHSGATASQGSPRLSVPDLMCIGAATAELLKFAEGGKVFAAAPRSDQTAPPTVDAPLSGEVLVVDDNPANRDLLTRMLERYGLHSHVSPDGPSALAQIGRERLDLVLLDLMMPGMSGVEVLDRIKADPQSRNLPVIMLSALDETSRVINCLERGAEDYVVKPFDPVLLIARLRSTLERSRLRVAESMRTRELQTAYEKLRENEGRLQESEERLRLATESAEVGIWYYHSGEDDVSMTPVCKRLFGFAEDDELLPWAAVREQIHPEDRAGADAQLARAIQQRNEYDIEFRVLWPDSSTHWISMRGLAESHGPLGEIRLAGVALEVTERKSTEEALIQAHKLESIGLLAGGIAHDFNNLLTGIIGSASFVMDNLDGDDPNAEMLQNVIAAGERAAALTRQLLAYSGKGKFTVHQVDLSKLVNEIAVLLRTSISRSVTLERHLEENLPAIEGDASQIQQIVMNLVINASEAIEGEGSVRLRTAVGELHADGRENIILGEDVAPGDYVYLEVSDTGSGMDRETLSKIFEPFFTTKFTGRGMGLAAVFGIVRGHDGALEVISAPGAGSTFRVYFPPIPGQVIARPESLRDAARVILFVDDEPVVRLMGKTSLERAGFAVMEASTGEEAFRILQDHRERIAVAVLDLNMPGWSGVETLRRLKQISPHLLTVLSTGWSEDELRARLPDGGTSPILQKPYSASTLVARVREVLR